MANVYKLEISYDGSNFIGFQRQNEGRSVQAELEKVISRLNSQIPIKIIASGRTDSKVHALKQVCSFNTNKELNLNYFTYALNQALPSDIRCNLVEKVSDDFHPRYQATKKHYRYLINIGEYNVFEYNYVYQFNRNLNLDAMIEAANLFIGKHDFRTFSSAPVEQNANKEIFSINITKKNDIIIIDYYGSGFLRYMVRKLTMFLIDIGLEKRKSNEIKTLLDKKDISAYSKIAPGQGLYLVDVSYDGKGDNNEND
ncbi:tRNA pseudouridine38-40 synthase [Bacilli bacterium PM5-3]|nr:tRNA pseudouridine38-40 synthase [Bacilli bacterium PM5-3]MDH6603456.1 tRNA pseudouridine38-40 synthase [Bacilli bacterium PM5-9]